MSKKTALFLQDYFAFEAILTDLFRRLGFTVTEGPIEEFDFIIQRERRHVVEVKYYRTARAQMTLLSSGILSILEASQANPSHRPLFIASCTISAEQRAFLKGENDLDILDGEDLIYLASNSPDLQEKLYALLEISPDTTAKSPSPDAYIFDWRQDSLRPPSNLTRKTKIKEGERLARELRNIPTGKSGWRKYENQCIKILKFLFEDNLTGWHPQLSSSDGLNRYDYVCRVVPTTEFWSLLSKSLQSRYVVFEFKNYEEPIKQGQILTTEKYLLERALRKTAIVMSRKGASEGALKMSQGAMRESGKLLITLSDEQVIEMLNKKDNGSDPSDYLFGIVDNFLLTLPR